MEQNNPPELNLACGVYSFAMCAGKYKAHTIAMLTQYLNLMEARQKACSHLVLKHTHEYPDSLARVLKFVNSPQLKVGFARISDWPKRGAEAVITLRGDKATGARTQRRSHRLDSQI